MRKEFSLNKEQYMILLIASRSGPMVIKGKGTKGFDINYKGPYRKDITIHRQQQVNAVWRTLGRIMGFKPQTVKRGRGMYSFSADMCHVK